MGPVGGKWTPLNDWIQTHRLVGQLQRRRDDRGRSDRPESRLPGLGTYIRPDARSALDRPGTHVAADERAGVMNGNGPVATPAQRMVVDPELAQHRSIYGTRRRRHLSQSTDYGATWTKLAGYAFTHRHVRPVARTSAPTGSWSTRPAARPATRARSLYAGAATSRRDEDLSQHRRRHDAGTRCRRQVLDGGNRLPAARRAHAGRQHALPDLRRRRRRTERRHRRIRLQGRPIPTPLRRRGPNIAPTALARRLVGRHDRSEQSEHRLHLDASIRWGRSTTSIARPTAARTGRSSTPTTTAITRPPRTPSIEQHPLDRRRADRSVQRQPRDLQHRLRPLSQHQRARRDADVDVLQRRLRAVRACSKWPARTTAR